MPQNRKHKNQHAPARQRAQPERKQRDGKAPSEARIIASHVAEVVEERIEHFSGPLPPPAVLQGYDEVVSGSAQIIIDRFVSQSEHRQHLERTVVEGNSKRSDRGLLLGFVLVLVVLAVGTLLVFSGYPTEGAIVLAIPLPTLAGVFVYGKRSQRQEREAKANLS